MEELLLQRGQQQVAATAFMFSPRQNTVRVQVSREASKSACSTCELKTSDVMGRPQAPQNQVPAPF